MVTLSYAVEPEESEEAKKRQQHVSVCADSIDSLKIELQLFESSSFIFPLFSFFFYFHHHIFFFFFIPGTL